MKEKMKPCLIPRCAFCRFKVEEGDEVIVSMLFPSIFSCGRQAVADQPSDENWDGSFREVPILPQSSD